MIPFYEMPAVGKLRETESRTVGVGGQGRGRQCLMGTELQFGRMGRGLEMESGDDCTAV